MKTKIRYDLLFRSQKYAQAFHNPIQFMLYQIAYKYIKQMKSQIIKPFSSVCVHGSFPQLIIPSLAQKDKNLEQLTLHSQIYDKNLSSMHKIDFINNQASFITTKQHQQYDLIISCLEGHHYDMSSLFTNYLSKLKPDGAVIGCCWAQNTLKQLRWAYMMAQNQRSGGISPKVFGFPGLGSIGHSMTMTKMKMPTIIVRDFEIQVDSVVDILTLIEMFGEAGYLHGRRKGVYKDLLLAMAAYYDSQFTISNKSQTQQSQSNLKKVNFSLQMGLFIGWKQHESQPKPLSRQKIINNSFFSQLAKTDSETKVYSINQQSEFPTQINISDLQKNETTKDDKK